VVNGSGKAGAFIIGYPRGQGINIGYDSGVSHMENEQKAAQPLDVASTQADAQLSSSEVTRREFVSRLRGAAVVPTATALSLVWTSEARAY
jgi:hypothetical protein